MARRRRRRRLTADQRTAARMFASGQGTGEVAAALGGLPARTVRRWRSWPETRDLVEAIRSSGAAHDEPDETAELGDVALGRQVLRGILSDARASRRERADAASRLTQLPAPRRDQTPDRDVLDELMPEAATWTLDQLEVCAHTGVRLTADAAAQWVATFGVVVELLKRGASDLVAGAAPARPVASGKVVGAALRELEAVRGAQPRTTLDPRDDVAGLDA